MKSLIPLLTLLAGVTSGFTQGTVTFANLPSGFSDSATVDRLVYFDSVGGGTKMAGTQYRAQLLFGVGGGLDTASLTPIGGTVASFYASTLASRLGVWSGGPRTLDSGTGITLPASAIGTLMVRVWDAGPTGNLTYDQATVKGRGNPFNYTPAPSGSPPDQFVMYGLRAFALLAPEPSAVALGVLGVAGLLLFRRRK